VQLAGSAQVLPFASLRIRMTGRVMQAARAAAAFTFPQRVMRATRDLVFLFSQRECGREIYGVFPGPGNGNPLCHTASKSLAELQHPTLRPR
jgi:hypothetical protein